MRNIERALQAHGYSLRHVIKCTVMLADMADWPAFNDVYREFFSLPYPARNAFGVNGVALGKKLEIDAIATAGGWYSYRYLSTPVSDAFSSGACCVVMSTHFLLNAQHFSRNTKRKQRF